MTLRRFALALPLLVALAHGQSVPVPRDEATGDPPAGGPGAAMLQAGEAALKAHQPETATQHLLRALVHRPWSPAVLRDLIEAAGEDQGARLLWARTYCAAVSDARGRAKLPADLRKQLGDDGKALVRLEQARARAAQELEHLVKGLRAPAGSNRGEEILAQWAARLAAAMVRPAPALARASAEPFAAAQQHVTYQPMAVVRALRKLMDGSLNGGQPALALKVAAVLRGLASQARQHDLRGPPPPDLGDVEAAAAAAQARARGALAAEAEPPLEIAQLLDMSEQERAAFTTAHADLAHPGRARSPSGRYVIETLCGYETLLGAARTIEFHHDRLARWFGSDPFDDRPGLVRIVPEAYGLEGEGAPYWWAGGFQSGDVTTVRFACSTIEGLGRVLTHELTHRFDGVLRPFQPSWLVEGKAVWTGGAYSATESFDFAEWYASPGAIQSAYVAGYGQKKKLTELIEGSIEDYRDNYTAGFALFVYLWSWQENGEFVFRDRLEQFEKNARAGQRKKLAFFVQHFADGEAGRPDGLDAFADAFATFLQGFYWKSRAPWTKRYVSGLGPRRQPKYVYDEPTWTWSRSRAEPFFGQDQASLAGDLLAAAGDRDGATGAYLWALRVDELTPERTARLEGLLHEAGRDVEAWALRRDPDQPAPAELRRKLPRLGALLGDYQSLVADWRQRGLQRAAAVLEADRRRLAEALGPPDAPLPVPQPAATSRHPFDEPPRLLGTYGWQEAALTGYDKRRVAGNWFETDGRDLHVGRKRPRQKSGLLDRHAYERPIFVRGRCWMNPGRYAIRTKVYLTTSYVRAALVFGHLRRDRDIRLQITAGDFLYATGEHKKAKALESVDVGLDSTWIRDNHLWGSTRSRDVAVRGSSGGIDLEVLVDGAEAVVFGNGERLYSFHTPDGSPIEGYVGFAAATGAIRLQEPTVQRLDRSLVLGLPAPITHLSTAGSSSAGEHGVSDEEDGDVETYLNESCAGIPGHPEGTIALWVPGGEVPGGPARLAERAAGTLAAAMRNDHLTQPVVVLVPDEVAAPARDQLAAALGGAMPGPVSVQPYRDPPPELEDNVWVMFVDGQGVLRVATTYVIVRSGYMPRTLRHWAKAYRGRR